MILKNGTLTLKSGMVCKSIGFRNVEINGNTNLIEVYKEISPESNNIFKTINYFSVDKDSNTLYELTFKNPVSLNYEDNFQAILNYTV